MKKTILTTSLTVLMISLFGQNFTPIPADTTSQWRITRGSSDGTCVNAYNSIYYVDDTLMHNGNVFYKIYETGEFYQQVISPPGPCNETYFYDGKYRGAIRTENGKTYQFDGWEENLLMDFTLNVGDTLFSYISPGLIIGSIDSVLVGDEYRRRFNFSNGDICNWMVEGIGHETGLFEFMFLAPDFGSEFHCYGESNIPLFGDLNCMLNVGYEEISNQNLDVSIYPNPTSGMVKINLPEQNQTTLPYHLTDLYGQIVSKKNAKLLDSQNFEINLEKFKSGIYFLTIQLSNNQTVYKKIVKK